jgi:hypothetical protein
MAGFSRYLSRKVLDHVFGTTEYTPPAHIYVALFTSSTVECTGTDYAREQCDVWDAASDVDNSVVKNTSIIDFGNAGAGGWGAVSHFALFDASSGTTNALTDVTALAATKTVNAGDPVTFAAGALQVTLD